MARIAQPDTRKSRLLIVEDEMLIAEAISVQVAQLGYELIGTAQSADEALEFLRAVRPDLALVDINLGRGGSGIELARRMREEHGLPVVFVTANSDPATVKEAAQTCPFGYVVKPFSRAILGATLETAMRRIETEQRLQRTERWLSITLESIRDAVVVLDARFRISLFNMAAEQLTGLSAEEAIGRDVLEMIDLKTPAGEPFLEHLLETALGEGTLRFHLSAAVRLVRRDGTDIAVEHSAARITEANARSQGVVLVLRESHGRPRREQPLDLRTTRHD